MERHSEAGQLALSLERPQQAVAQYQAALARARERDDAGAIADFGFDLAVAELQANQPDAALQSASETEAELIRRGSTLPPALQLAQAIALYRSGEPQAADRLAAQVETAGDRDTAARAAFLRGLIADNGGNVGALRVALSRITSVAGAEHEADADELSARLDLRNGDARRASAEAERVVERRRQLLDYRSMARGLALAAQAAEQAGDTALAADLYFRAGRSATADGERTEAKHWLALAITLSRDPVLTRAARSVLATADNR